MKITFLVVGKTNSASLKAIEDDYLKRISRYCKTEMIVIETSSIKTTQPDKVKTAEGLLILKKINNTDHVVLLDENGKQFSSVEFSSQLENLMGRSLKNICFVVGGAYGFSEEVYQRANAKLSLSKMTFSHQIVRIIFLEQLYRAYTILNNEPYHHA